ncbi:hypothetical protein Plo01_26030 [Planobispora longispora]|uniref:HTH cro/C1-type domain-containing protein n=3 Tax=Planobispora longispora TaxID=28887 RepID=A0A8J3W488_9ACTN|nr:hypothetical protein Plo01_26030 [Planobispora longispora]
MADSMQRATTDFVSRDVQGNVQGPAHPLFEAVQRALATKGWTVSELWRRSGVARSTITQWATQPRPPQSATVIAVADALGIAHEEALRLAGILESEPQPSSAGRPDVEDERLAALQAELEATLSKMSPRDRARWEAEMRREEVERLERWRRLLDGQPPISD